MDKQGISKRGIALADDFGIVTEADLLDINSFYNSPRSGKKLGAMYLVEMGEAESLEYVMYYATGNQEDSPWQCIVVETDKITPEGTLKVATPFRDFQPSADPEVAVNNMFIPTVKSLAELSDVNSPLNRLPHTSLKKLAVVICEEDQKFYFAQVGEPIKAWQSSFGGDPIMVTGTIDTFPPLPHTGAVKPVAYQPPNVSYWCAGFTSTQAIGAMLSDINDNLLSGKSKGTWAVAIDSLRTGRLAIVVAHGSEKDSKWTVMQFGNVSAVVPTAISVTEFTNVGTGTHTYDAGSLTLEVIIPNSNTYQGAVSNGVASPIVELPAGKTIEYKYLYRDVESTNTSGAENNNPYNSGCTYIGGYDGEDHTHLYSAVGAFNMKRTGDTELEGTSKWYNNTGEVQYVNLIMGTGTQASKDTSYTIIGLGYAIY